MFDLIHILLFLSVVAQLLTIVIKAGWGVLSIKEGRQGRPLKIFVRSWEFFLGMMLISASMVLCLFEALAITVLFDEDLEVNGWTVGFALLSMHSAFWAGLACWRWWTRRFDPYLDT